MPAPNAHIRDAIVKHLRAATVMTMDRLRAEVAEDIGAPHAEIAATYTAMITEGKLHRKGDVLMLSAELRGPTLDERNKAQKREEEKALADRLIRQLRAFGPHRYGELHERLFATRVGAESTRRRLLNLAERGLVHEDVDGRWHHGSRPSGPNGTPEVTDGTRNVPAIIEPPRAEENTMSKCTKEAVLALLAERQHQASELADRLGVSTERVRQILQPLSRAGEVTFDPSPSGARVWRLAVTAGPPAEVVPEVVVPPLRAEVAAVIPPAGDDLDEVLTALGLPTDLTTEEAIEAVRRLIYKPIEDVHTFRRELAKLLIPLGGPTDEFGTDDGLLAVAKRIATEVTDGRTMIHNLKELDAAARATIQHHERDVTAVEQLLGIQPEAKDTLSWRILRIGDVAKALQRAQAAEAERNAVSSPEKPDPAKVPMFHTVLRIEVLERADVHQGRDPWEGELWPYDSARGRREVGSTFVEVLRRLLDELDHRDSQHAEALLHGRSAGLTGWAVVDGAVVDAQARADVDEEPGHPAPPTQEGTLVLSQAAELGRLRDLVRQLETALRSETRRRMSAQALLRAIQAGVDDVTGGESAGAGIEDTIRAVAEFGAEQRSDQNIANTRRALGVAS